MKRLGAEGRGWEGDFSSHDRVEECEGALGEEVGGEDGFFTSDFHVERRIITVLAARGGFVFIYSFFFTDVPSLQF